VNLNTSLEAFRAQAASGTVHGPGTPAVTIVDTAAGGGGSEGGAAGVFDAAALALLVAAGWRGRRAR